MLEGLPVLLPCCLIHAISYFHWPLLKQAFPSRTSPVQGSLNFLSGDVCDSSVRSVHSGSFPKVEDNFLPVVLLSTSSEILWVGLGILGYFPHSRLGELAALKILSVPLSQTLLLSPITQVPSAHTEPI